MIVFINIAKVVFSHRIYYYKNYFLKMTKKHIVKDYESLPDAIIKQVKATYPHGFAQSLIAYIDKEGKKVSALPFDAGDIYYLIRMTTHEAQQIIEADEDYDDEGNLRVNFNLKEQEIPEDTKQDILEEMNTEDSGLYKDYDRVEV